jgi:hypothetical protein
MFSAVSGSQSWAVTAFVVGAILAAAPAHSQSNGAAIGQMIGNMQVARKAAEAEEACRAGQPASPDNVAKVTDRMNRVMSAYFDLNAQSDARSLSRVFAMKNDKVQWKDDKGPTPIDQLGDRLRPPAATPTLTAVVVGGDALSGRELWTVPASNSDAAGKVYAVDFITELGHAFDYALGIRILRLSISPASEAPAAPGAFCHLVPVRGR